MSEEDPENGSGPGLGALVGVGAAISAVITALAAESEVVKAWAIIGFAAIVIAWFWYRSKRKAA